MIMEEYVLACLPQSMVLVSCDGNDSQESSDFVSLWAIMVIMEESVSRPVMVAKKGLTCFLYRLS